MPSSYEFWLLDDKGRRITLLTELAYFSYSRVTRGFGSFQIGLPYDAFTAKVQPFFEPDWRVDIWRSPETGYPLRREGTYLLRMPKIYTRTTDNVQIITFYGRDLKDLLRRRYIIQPAGYAQTLKTDYIDDMMKEIVEEQMLWGSALDASAVQDNARAYPQNEFTVQGKVSLGPVHTATFSDRNVLDTLKELEDASFQLYDEDPLLYTRIYFDIIPFDMDGGMQGFQFVTYAGLKGEDRTGSALIFSVENNNIKEPYYTLNHMSEVNSVIVKGFGRGDSRPAVTVTDTRRAGASRWNLCEAIEDASTEPDQNYLDNYGYPPLWEGAPKEEISAVFLNVPGSEDTPRSLYGIDWDIGDLLPVEYAGMHFNTEVNVAYVAIDEGGRETITGRNSISAGDQ